MSCGHMLPLEVMSALLKQHGHEVYAVVDNTFNPNKNVVSNEEKRNLVRIKDLNPDLVGFTAITPRYQWCLKFAELIKKMRNIPIIFGGSHPTAYPEEVLKNDCVDMVCRGEGELALLELVNNPEQTDVKNIWFKKDGEIIKNPLRPLIQDLDSLPFPDKELWEGIIPKSYFETYQIVASRGCLMNCYYCQHNYLKKIYGNKGYFRRRSVGNIVKELKWARLKYNIQRVAFMDDHFTEDKEWFTNFANEYYEQIYRPFNLRYACLSHPNFLDKFVLLGLKYSGCHLLMLGVQTGDEEVRKKVINRPESNKKLLEIAYYCHKFDLPFSIDHLFGLPYADNLSDMLESAKLYNEMRPINISTYRLYFFPKTDIIDIAKESSMINSQFEQQIIQGVHQEVTIRAVRDPKYVAFSSLFTFLPLLPKSVVDVILRYEPLLDSFKKIPMFMIWVGKGLNNLRLGNSYVLTENLRLLPKNILNRFRGYRGEFEIPRYD